MVMCEQMAADEADFQRWYQKHLDNELRVKELEMAVKDYDDCMTDLECEMAEAALEQLKDRIYVDIEIHEGKEAARLWLTR